LYELEALQPESEPDAPLAIGGTIECDGYSLPTTAVELVFRQNGWRARSLGSRLPFGSMLNAIHDNRPDLFWISVSHISDESRFVDEYSEFYEQVGHELPIVLGGRAIHEKLRPQLRFATCCDRLQQLESFIQSLRPARLHETGP
jgi:methanogenic corrinoid protein MtbC1